MAEMMVQRQAVRRARTRRHDGGASRGYVALACALSVACGVCASARAEEASCPDDRDERAAVHDAAAHGKWLTRWNQGNIGACCVCAKAPPFDHTFLSSSTNPTCGRRATQ